MTAFLQMLQEEVDLPMEATLVGSAVEVIDFDLREDGREVTTHCRHGVAEQETLLAELRFAADAAAAWLHAALPEHAWSRAVPAEAPAGWKPDWL